MRSLYTFFVCLWHTLLRHDFAMEQSYQEFLSIEEQKQKRKLEKLKRVHVRANLTPSIQLRSGLIHNSNGTIRFRPPVPIVIVHLNQVISGSKTLHKGSYLYPLFSRCRNNQQVLATAQYYLDLLNEDMVDTRALVIWCALRIHDIEKETREVDICTVEVYVNEYSKPSREIVNKWDIEIGELEYVARYGKPKYNQDFFEFCRTPMDYHYTALWYINRFNEQFPK